MALHQGDRIAEGPLDDPAGVRPDKGVGLSLLVGLFALLGLFLAIAAIVVAFNRPKGATTAASSSEVTGSVELSEFAIKGDLTLPPGNVTLKVTNTGSMVHTLQVDGGAKTPNIQPGQTVDLKLGDLAEGHHDLICDIPGHAAAGMKAMLMIDKSTASPGAGAAAGAGGTTETTMNWAKMDQDMIDSMKAFPAATDGRGNQVLAPTIGPDGAKQFDLTAKIIDWEVEPGKTVKAWAYNDQVPGPQIKVNVGDHVKIKLTNDLPVATDIHSHGISLPNDMDGVAGITQDPIKPGETFTYDFVAEKPAVGMYHAHMHGPEAVPNGLFGAFLIGEPPLPAGRTISGVAIPADLKIAQEMPMVLNDAGAIGLSLNGKSFPATDPIVANVGDWIEVHYMNEGLQMHPMHVHQFNQLVIAKDGVPLDNPYYADTLSVAPGERYTVLFHVDKPGTWLWHCHILNHVERESGMFGMATAIVAKPV
jgi:uncharacterized cupredoxin-like copper-binding protein